MYPSAMKRFVCKQDDTKQIIFMTLRKRYINVSSILIMMLIIPKVRDELRIWDNDVDNTESKR